ncbi:MAG TPA: transglutaminase domain-containing protein [Candidatus Nanoarchaeia archaeon]|nr:transglutaminase domain-containing protein [Candidatus Nanoarchaeia archaeon]
MKKLLLAALLGASAIACQQPTRTVYVEKPVSVPVYVERPAIRPSHEPSLMLLTASDPEGWEWHQFISTSSYLWYKQQLHTPRWDYTGQNYTEFVTPVDPAVRGLARFLTVRSQNTEDAAQRILDYVHGSCVYQKDPEGSEYVKYPLETLIERNGDCEDLAILSASLMHSVGIPVALILYPDHMSLGVSGNFFGASWYTEGRQYFHAEAVGTEWIHRPGTWRIGEMPEERKREKAYVFPLKVTAGNAQR